MEVGVCALKVEFLNLLSMSDCGLVMRLQHLESSVFATEASVVEHVSVLGGSHSGDHNI